MAYKQKGWSPFTKEDKLHGREWRKKKKEIIKLSKLPWNKGKFGKGENLQYQLDKAKQGITTSGYLDAKYRRKGKSSYFADDDVMGAPTDWTKGYGSSDPIPTSGDKSRKARKQLVRDKIHKDARHYSAQSPKTYTKEYIKSKFSRSTRNYKKALKQHGFK
jgi:hypothetical protein